MLDREVQCVLDRQRSARQSSAVRVGRSGKMEAMQCIAVVVVARGAEIITVAEREARATSYFNVLAALFGIYRILQ